VLEKESRGGGHCQTVQEQKGFTYDAGGPHIIFSRNQEMVDYMVSLLGDNVHRARRNNKIFYKGRYVKYPFENGLFDLEPQDRFECLYHYIKNDYPPPQTNFKEWIYHHFGKGLAEKYLIPYNEKIWNVPAEELGLEWVEGRVPKPPLEDVIKAAVGVETEGYTHQLYFHYPAHGGIESLPRAMAEGSHVSPDFTVERIWREGSGWCVSNGRVTRRYDALVSTIPIQELAAALEGTPPEILAAVDALRYNSLVTVSVGWTPRASRLHRHLRSRPRDPLPSPVVPGRFQPAQRAARPIHHSGRNHHQPRRRHARDVGRCAALGRNRSDLQIWTGDSPLGSLLRTRVLRTKYGYVVQNDDCRRYLKQAKAYFEQIGIPLCGRVAEFEYINMDVCIERARTPATTTCLRRAATF
jgi:hypothetical protein